MPIVVPGIGAANPPGITTVTLDTLIKRVRKELEPEPWEDKLTVTVTDGATKWTEGQTGEFDDATGSQFRVVDTANPLVNPIAVKMGHNDSPITTHLINSVVLQNPRFGYDIISEALTRVILNETWPYMWSVAATAITPNISVTNIYNVPTDFKGLIAASQLGTESITTFWSYGNTKYGQLPITIRSGIPSATSNSNEVFEFPGGFYNTTNPVTIQYRASLTTTSVQEGEMADCVVMGACARLVEMKEVPETSQDMSIAPPPGAASGQLLRSGSYYRSLFMSMRRAIKADLWREQKPARVWVS